MANFLDRIKKAFLSREPTKSGISYGGSSSYSPYRGAISLTNIRSIVSNIYNRIAVDVSSIDFRHVRLTDDDKYDDVISSGLNDCLKLDANLDQSKQAFFIDLVMSLIDEGYVALVPSEISNSNTSLTEIYAQDILAIRVGKIVTWYPQHVEVEVYNESTGMTERIVLSKRIVPIIENPFYCTMNEPNSTLKRLTRVLNQLDKTNSHNSSGKLDMLIKLPYKIVSEARRKFAESRRKDISDQLEDSSLGIAYIDATEQVIQLNRSLENNLWTQAKELTADLYNQTGVTENIINGTASEEELTNYYDRTITPFCEAIVEEIERKWLSKTARTQKQAIRFFRNPFKIVPVTKLAEIADKFTRNEIASSNEIRSVIGWKPSDDPRADQLINANINQESSRNFIRKNNEEEETDKDEI